MMHLDFQIKQRDLWEEVQNSLIGLRAEGMRIAGGSIMRHDRSSDTSAGTSVIFTFTLEIPCDDEDLSSLLNDMSSLGFNRSKRDLSLKVLTSSRFYKESPGFNQDPWDPYETIIAQTNIKLSLMEDGHIWEIEENLRDNFRVSLEMYKSYIGVAVPDQIINQITKDHQFRVLKLFLDGCISSIIKKSFQERSYSILGPEITRQYPLTPTDCYPE